MTRFSPVHTITLHGKTTTFVFRFRDRDRSALLKRLGQMASDPGNEFSWYMAAQVSARVRKMQEASK